MSLPTKKGWKFWVDKGGTFTDVVGLSSDGILHVTKVLSDVRKTNGSEGGGMLRFCNEPYYCDAVRGIRQLLQLKSSDPFPSHMVDVVKVGTTIGTNALLERQGAKTVLLTTLGFKDALIIRHQTRSDLFALNLERKVPLFDHVIEVEERVLADGSVLIDLNDLRLHTLKLKMENLLKQDPSIESVAVVFLHSYRFPNHELKVQQLLADMGIKNIFLSSLTESMQKFIPRAETTVIDAYLTPLISRYVNDLSKQLAIEDDVVEPPKSPGRSVSSVSNSTANKMDQPRLFFMKSDGALTESKLFHGRDSLLSGPAGGVVGAWKVCSNLGYHEIISFDMGGTSTDVCHLDGTYTNRLETEVAGVTLCRPSVPVHTIAAGGGSIIRYEGSRLIVGPQSAGAIPGPACYDRGGPFTVTDCNVALGRIQPAEFPKVFGQDGKSPLNYDIVVEKIKQLQSTISSDVPDNYATAAIDWISTPEQIAEKCIEIACRQMSSAIKKITSNRGINIEKHVICCFGGAGGQHACRLAEILGLSTIVIHPLASVLSAAGIGMADISRSMQLDVDAELTQETLDDKVRSIAISQGILLSEELTNQKIAKNEQTLSVRVRLRYKGTDTVLEFNYHEQPILDFEIITACGMHLANKKSVAVSPSNQENQFHTKREQQQQQQQEQIKKVSECLEERKRIGKTASSLREDFLVRHKNEFGFCLKEDHGIEIASVEVEVKARSKESQMSKNWTMKILNNSDATTPPVPTTTAQSETSEDNLLLEDRHTTFCKVFFNAKWWKVPLLKLWDLPESGQIEGPVIIIDPIGTNAIFPGWKVRWNRQKCLVVEKIGTTEHVLLRPKTLSIPDPFWLELFNHYFSSVAEEMGTILQQTSQSINIKERLDFSCALFDQDGYLIANAPHIPVHLGSMGESVRSLLKSQKGEFKNGDVFVSNNPFNGGTHLPDITVMTPVFLGGVDGICDDNEKPFAFVASRAHHADIGGITPGSMPALSQSLQEEGIIFDNVPIVKNHQFCLSDILSQLKSSPWPARNPHLNVADLKAQIAANQRGADELRRGVKTFGKDTVQTYMEYVLDGGKKAVCKVIQNLCLPSNDLTHSFVCKLDGDCQIAVHVQIERSNHTIFFDFDGTSPTNQYNLNATTAIVRAAILYVLRCLIDEPSVPLNEGCFRPIQFNAPFDTLINPKPGAAVAAGNVEISQCLVNALFGCLGLMAGSQCTMNNLSFGNAKFQYYETLCGGAGAGPSFNGCSAIHTHMTNSRMTDTELLEVRSPVVVLQFSIRRDSGGAGKFRGGDGAVRILGFLEQVGASLLSNNREVEPFGLLGGGNGKKGKNYHLSSAYGIRHESNDDEIDIDESTVSESEKNRLLRNMKFVLLHEISATRTSPMPKSPFLKQKLDGRVLVDVKAGDILIIKTPGGGGMDIFES